MNLSVGKRIKAMMLALSLCRICLFSVSAQGKNISPSAKMKEYILQTEWWVHENVYDINNDGKLNCLDHTVLWKLYWDNHFPKYKKHAEIVRNKNAENGMNHVFIRLFDAYNHNTVIEVEPFASNPNYYLMNDN